MVTRDPDRQAQLRVAVPGVRVLSDADQLWAAGVEHDLVIIATPTGTHLSMGLAALEAGLAVVIDKPMASTAAEAGRLARAATNAGAWLSVFHNRRWDGETLTIGRLIADGSLGTVSRFESRFERWRPTANVSAWRESVSGDEGGGTLLDLGSHLVDQATYLFGPALSVYAEVRQLREDVAADDDVFMALEHASGVRSHLWASAVAAHQGPSVRVLGRAGAYVKEGLDIQEDALRRGERPNGADWGREAPGLWGRLYTGGAAEPIPTADGDWPAYYREVVRSLLEGAPPPVTAAEGVAVMEILDAARESARTHQVVSIDSRTA